MNEIRFYSLSEPYGFFSNFSPHPIFIDGDIWATVEHYFQISKFDNIELKRKLKLIASPMKVANEGRSKRNILRSDWEDVKESIMLKALKAKFLQHPEIKERLVNTNNALLIESTAIDDFWGSGSDGNGKNKLGLLLMEVRSYMMNISMDYSVVFPPWIAFPGVSQLDLFWKMGLGEDYLTKWMRYFSQCSDKEAYVDKFPEDKDWEGFYD